ncbi:MAG: hypothetical protein ACC662_03030 [Planctomycetota bacterium]
MTVLASPEQKPFAKAARILVVVLTGGLFVSGALLLTDWLRDRDATLVARPLRAVPPRASPLPIDPRVEVFLGGGVAWSPGRLDRLGRSPAVFVVGHDLRGPKEVFARMLEGGWDDEARLAVLREGPSAAVALRSQATVGMMRAGAFLVRMAPDLDAARRGRLVTEPGAVTLAFRKTVGWDYVTWAFPEALPLDGPPEASRAPPRALTPLGGAAARLLEPVFAFGGGEGGPKTILCRSRGPAVDAVRELAARLGRRGWVRRYVSEAQGPRVVRVLGDGRNEVWLTAEAGGGGMVSVMLSSL